ncbi:hypothetical protein ACU21_07510 [Actinobaculum suis]|uniref:NINE protein n=1 Tax=Actinobaculum suis TaxID=1657 RepID=UPI0008087327|nr:TM2 domain-containing protein [Actinobaculum suis]OCA93997.1 hypothetical protein ACU21_07510 [Actinobaculum suis]
MTSGNAWDPQSGNRRESQNGNAWEPKNTNSEPSGGGTQNQYVYGSDWQAQTKAGYQTGNQQSRQPGAGNYYPGYGQAGPTWNTAGQNPYGTYQAYPQGAPYNYPYGAPYYQQKSRLIAGLLGIFLGGLGVHRFYLGYTAVGVAQIVVSVFTFGLGSLWGFIEGICIIAGTAIQEDVHGIPLRD